MSLDTANTGEAATENAFTRFFAKHNTGSVSLPTGMTAEQIEEQNNKGWTDQHSTLSSSPTATSNSSKHHEVDKRKKTESEEKYTKNIAEKILAKHATPTPAGKHKQRFSKRISLTENSKVVPVLCELTGAVASLQIPSLPVGKENPYNKGGYRNPIVLSYISPYGIYENARTLAQAGAKYLKQLDTQIIAAICITLADNYDLFVYQPSDTGVQKNAILRTVDKDTLIDCILLIETMIHSANCSFLPSLSLRSDITIAQNGIAVRMKEWLKLVVDRIYEPDTQTYDEAMTLSKLDNKPTIAKAKREKIALHKEFRAWKTGAKEDIATLYKAQKISAKLKAFLTQLLAGNNLQNADPEMIVLLSNKMLGMDDTTANEIGDQINFFFAKLSDEAVDFDDVIESFASQPVGSAIQPIVKSTENEFASNSETAGQGPYTPLDNLADPSKQENERTAFANPVGYATEQANKPMSFIEKLKARKAQENARSAENQDGQ